MTGVSSLAASSQATVSARGMTVPRCHRRTASRCAVPSSEMNRRRWHPAGGQGALEGLLRDGGLYLGGVRAEPCVPASRLVVLQCFPSPHPAACGFD